MFWVKIWTAIIVYNRIKDLESEPPKSIFGMVMSLHSFAFLLVFNNLYCINVYRKIVDICGQIIRKLRTANYEKCFVSGANIYIYDGVHYTILTVTVKMTMATTMTITITMNDCDVLTQRNS